jgi:hypothetical protein
MCGGICRKRYAHDRCNTLDKASRPRTATSRMCTVTSRRMTLFSIDRQPANSSRSCEMVSVTCTNDSPRETGSVTRRNVAREGSVMTYCSTGYHRHLLHHLSHPPRKPSGELGRWQFSQRGPPPSKIALQHFPRRP